MTLYDAIARDEVRPMGHGESLFHYYNGTGRPYARRIRSLQERWFARYPDGNGKVDLRARFRSPIDAAHQAAEFEIYTHELLASMGYQIKTHPPLVGTSKTPDFLTLRDRRPQFYAECTLAGSSEEDKAADARVGYFLDALNRLRTRDFFLTVSTTGYPTTAPSAKRLRQELLTWLEALNPDEATRRYTEGGYKALPTYSWSHENWWIDFRAVPKKPTSRATNTARPVGSILESSIVVESEARIRAAVLRKAGKYGTPDLPLVVGVNVTDDHLDDGDVMEALFGDRRVDVVITEEGMRAGEACREPNGVWFGPAGPRNRDISAVFVVERMSAGDAATRTPLLVHNPWTYRPLAPGLWPLNQLVPGKARRRMRLKRGVGIRQVLRLPTQWPPKMF